MFELHCRDAGFDCAGVVRAETKEAVLAQAAIHAREHHQVEVTPQMAEKISTLIRRTDAGAKGAAA
jgi:predicted small metal-binding protein